MCKFAIVVQEELRRFRNQAEQVSHQWWWVARCKVYKRVAFEFEWW